MGLPDELSPLASWHWAWRRRCSRPISYGGTNCPERTHGRSRAWMLAHVPAGSRVLFERDTPQFSREQYQFMLVIEGQPTAVEAKRHGIAHALFVPDGQIGQLRDPEAIRRERVAYMVLSVSSWYQRYVAERERYPEVVATYETVMRMGTKLYEIQRIPGVNDGPSIRVYRVDGTD